MARRVRYADMVQPHLKEIEEWAGSMSEADISKKLGVAYSTFQNYKKEYSELTDALRRGKQQLSIDLKKSLKTRAKGYWYDETKTKIVKQPNEDREMVVVEEITETTHKYAAPDVGAIHLLLKNWDESWTNDDAATLELKRRKLEADEAKSW